MERAATQAEVEAPTGVAIEGLLDWRPEHGVLSVCLEIDAADRGEGWLIDLRNKVEAAIEAGDDAHERGRALRVTGQRVLERFEDEELPSGRTHLGFCEVAERRARDIWTSAQISGFKTEVGYGDRPRLTALLKLLVEGAPVGAVAVSAERVHLYEWRLGALELLQDWEIEMYMRDWREQKSQRPADPAQTQGAGASGRDQFDQRLGHNRARFLEETGRLIAAQAHDRAWRRVIAFGDPEHVREVDVGAAKGTEIELAEQANLISEERGKLLERVNAAIADSSRRHALALIGRAVEGAATPGGHGALGLNDVQRCLNEGRVEHLLFDADAQQHELADIEDEIVERAIRTSAQVTPVEGEAADALREHGGVAAVLRY